ncbi:hypothetical protein NpPPO83_00012674 [Neofusicoccum parvum]|uniref:Uncharacterized protein n=1 Tax=Neofusicoccum parvum TaxID=310453 RepID=A0ACB5SP70_9PEZI|nr:hypothetical protein NpPPO83_00012674 [Neofusicoccum parvum]
MAAQSKVECPAILQQNSFKEMLQIISDEKERKRGRAPEGCTGGNSSVAIADCKFRAMGLKHLASTVDQDLWKWGAPFRRCAEGEPCYALRVRDLARSLA